MLRRARRPRSGTDTDRPLAVVESRNPVDAFDAAVGDVVVVPTSEFALVGVGLLFDDAVDH
jgi:hypothetical protein